MTLATLAIQTEAWVQEEIGAQRQLLESLTRAENAARAGRAAELERGWRELESLLALAPAREARRRVLHARLASEFELPLAAVTLTRLIERQRALSLDTQRIEALRAELREVVAAVLKLTRRFAALAQYHRGLFEELCKLLATSDPTSPETALIDAHA